MDQENIKYVDDNAPEESGGITEPEKVVNKGSRSLRQFLLLGIISLLLIWGGMIYFFHYSAPPQGQIVRPVHVVMQPIPQKPPEAVLAKPVLEEVDTLLEMAEKQQPVPVEPVEDISPAKLVAADKEISPADLSSAVDGQVVDGVAVDTGLPVQIEEKMEPALAVSVTEESALPEKEETAIVSPVVDSEVVRPNFVLQAGAFQLLSNAQTIVEKISELGFEARIKQIDVSLDVTRLHVGRFHKEEAYSVLEKLKTDVESPFILSEEEYYTVYAGSYHQAGTVEEEAERLHERGYAVFEEKVTVPVPLHTVSFGSFATRDEAENMAEKATQSGFDVYVDAVTKD